MSIDNPIVRINKIRFDIERVYRLGGRTSFLGMLEIFEIILKEEHEKNDKETGMYRFKGMEQYGNIVSPKSTYLAIDTCVKELKFTKEEFDKLIDWYKDRNYGPDTRILSLVIGWCLKDKKYFE